jgi:arylsulfatase A-like enzyme
MTGAVVRFGFSWEGQWNAQSRPRTDRRSSRMRISSRAARWIVLVELGLCVACGRAGSGVESLLVDERALEILVERPNLARPTKGPGTRFVSGWRFVRGDSGMRISPTGADCRLELVHLGQRTRFLELRLRPGFSESTITAWAGSRALGVYPLASRVVVEVPADLPIGRVPVTLELSDPSGVALKGASVRPCRDGAADIDDGEVFQSGWSAVEIVRPVVGRPRLTGRFAPPIDPSPEQRFAVLVDDGVTAGVTVFEWHAGERHGPGSELDFAARIESDSGFARVRLVSEGPGPVGRWSDLAIGAGKTGPPVAPEPSPKPPRLVILYVMDALRADALGHLGSERGTSPVLDRLASEGVSFSRHFSVAPNTPTSTTALFTGWCPIDGGALPGDGPQTLAESFAAAGYRTAAVTGNPYISASHGLARGFESVSLVRFEEDFRPHAPPTPNDSAERVHRSALEWIDTLTDNERAFLYLHTLHPHNPYSPPEPFQSRYAAGSASSISGGTRTLVEIRDGVIEPTAGDRQRLRALYAANLAYNDTRLGLFLKQLERRFPKEELLLVLTSDHGEELFDHGGVLHGFTLYDEMVHVPLIVWWPTRIEPRRVQSSTDTLDLHATLRVMADVAHAPKTGVRSLWPLICGQDPGPPDPEVRFAFAAGERPLYMARTRHRKLILAPGRGLDWGMGRGRSRTFDAEYLFDLVSDPGEQVNAAGSSDLEADWLRSRLRSWIDGWRQHEFTTVEPVVDETTRQQLEALGYTQ